MNLIRPLAIPEPEFAELVAAYGQPQRHYHTLSHISALLTGMENCRALLNDVEAVELAIWFHDAIYDPQANDNEERSASLARNILKERLIPQQLERVCALILATKKHEIDSVTAKLAASDAAYFLDLDLQILGAESEYYDDYEAAVRREYHYLPDSVWREGRSAVLQRFLARPRLYFSDFFADKLEKRARENLAHSLEKLRV